MSESTPEVVTAASSIPAATSALLMAVVEEASDLLLHGSEGALSDLALWYLDMGATNHMTSRQIFFCDLDESAYGLLNLDIIRRSKLKVEVILRLIRRMWTFYGFLTCYFSLI